jgi:hypothetical protein
MPKRHLVHLSGPDRIRLSALIAAGTAPARTLTHARILLKADQGADGPAWPDARIAEALETSVATVERVRRRWVTGGLADALGRRPPRREYRRQLDGAGEAHLIALACSAPPPGQQRWSLRLLGAKLVELELVEAIAPNTVRAVLKKTRSSPG